jgi:hypothetical protein
MLIPYRDLQPKATNHIKDETQLTCTFGYLTPQLTDDQTSILVTPDPSPGIRASHSKARHFLLYLRQG